MRNLITCPICLFESENLTTHIIKIHDMTVKDFKKQFCLDYVQSERLRIAHKSNLQMNNPTKGTKRSADEIIKMSSSRKGKGIGNTGKYERTPEIRSKISEGVVLAHFRGDYDNAKPGNGSFIFSRKANATIFARSTWEHQLIKIFDKHPAINSITNEPFVIPYFFEGSRHNYIPDFLVVYDDVIKSIWEVKRDDFINGDPKTIAKLAALNDYCHIHDMNMIIVDSKLLKRLSNYVRTLND